MATYYRWQKSDTKFSGHQTEAVNGIIADTTSDKDATLGLWTVDASNIVNTGEAIVKDKYEEIGPGEAKSGFSGTYAIFYGEKDTVSKFFHLLNDSGRYNTVYNNSGQAQVTGKGSYAQYYYRQSYGYVYSLNPSQYPSGEISGDYYYGTRTTIQSPSSPSSISYPSEIRERTVTVSWSTAQSNVPSYRVSGYELSYSTDGGGSWNVISNPSGTSYDFSVPVSATSIKFRVRAKDTNGQWGEYKIGGTSKVIMYPELTIPSVSMQTQPIFVSWSSVSDADSYILQRKVDSGEWEQVYSGTLTSFTDTAGSWSTVQYRVCGVFSGTNGAFAQSNVITVVPASALVISGQDGDLGTITSDISYSVATDTGNPISLTLAVNGAQFFSGSVGTSYTSKIPVMDLPTGTNTIVITASVQASSGQVTVTRTWIYTKVAQTFPGSGGVAQLTQNGQNVFPMTLAEAVKAIGGPWGGNLSSALNKLAMAATYSSQTFAKYTEVKVDLSKVQAGDIVNLPVNGVMVPHIVVQVGNPDPSMYDSSCNGVWLLRKDIVENGQWNSTNVNTLAGSTIMSTMAGYVSDYDSTVQAAIQTVKIPYCVGGGDTTVKTLADGLECKMFPLSARELGANDSVSNSLPNDGVKLDYFDLTNNTTSVKRVAKYNGSPARYFSRSPADTGNSDAFFVFEGGSFGNTFASDSSVYGYRYCFLLPTTFTATYYVDESGNVYPSQEYTTAGDFYDLWGKVIPTVKIATGSYVGTGTTGSGNPNTLTLPFEPKVVFIQGEWSSSVDDAVNKAIIICSSDFFETDYHVIGNSTGSQTTGGGVCNLTVDGNTISWYLKRAFQSTNDVYVQLNLSGATYTYVAFG